MQANESAPAEPVLLRRDGAVAILKFVVIHSRSTAEA